MKQNIDDNNIITKFAIEYLEKNNGYNIEVICPNFSLNDDTFAILKAFRDDCINFIIVTTRLQDFYNESSNIDSSFILDIVTGYIKKYLMESHRLEDPQSLLPRICFGQLALMLIDSPNGTYALVNDKQIVSNIEILTLKELS